tara:strand:+ start:1500 stop:1721 length:222 start_codon:yes stop_codon:yes gene_type:complete
MEVLRLDDVGPDGVRFIIDWDQVRVGDSVFIPCLNVALADKQIRAIFERRQWELRVQVRTENHILGVRIWRTT